MLVKLSFNKYFFVNLIVFFFGILLCFKIYLINCFLIVFIGFIVELGF